MIPLIRSQRTGNTLAPFEVEVVYVEASAGANRRGRGTFQARLPSPDAPSTYVAWTIHSPEGSKVRRRTVDGTLERVKQLSYPIPPATPGYVEVAAQPQLPPPVQAAAQVAPTELQELKSGELAPPAAAPTARGADPVLVSLPLQGVETYFEKTLALGEPLEVTFSYRGLRKRR